MSKKERDWEAIELDFRAGTRSLRDIAAQHGVTHQGITKRAKREGWTRDLRAKIDAETRARVTSAAVTTSVTTEKRVSEREIIEANAETQTQIILAHRADIRAGRAVAVSLVEELGVLSEYRIEFEELGEIMREPDDKGRDKRNEIYNAVISFHGRVDAIKKLAEATKTYVGMEREAFGIESRHSLEGQEVQNLKIAFVTAGIPA